MTIGFGANLGRPDLAFQNALRDLDETPGLSLTAVSRLWRSAPWGVTDQPAFVNAAARFDTFLEPAALLRLVKDLEQDAGLRDSGRWGPRHLDLDLLTYGDRCVSEDGLTLPHAHLAERTFVLEPLAEIGEGVPEAYARHFRIVRATCSLVMLESEADYKRFGIRARADDRVVAARPATALLASRAGATPADSRNRASSWATLGRMSKSSSARARPARRSDSRAAGCAASSARAAASSSGEFSGTSRPAAPSPASMTCRVFSITPRATRTGFSKSCSAATAPASRLAPSMMDASSST